MRIAIDARMMGPENTRGIGRYIEELIRVMLNQETDNRYVLIVRKPDHPFKDNPAVETVVADIPWYGLAEQFKMSGVFRRTKADLVHVPHWNAPIFYRDPLVITIHDLLLRHYPASAKSSTRGPLIRWLKQAGYRTTIAQAVRHARRILVPTEFVKNDVESFYPSAKGKITVTGEGMPGIVASSSHLVARSDQSPSYQLPATSYLLYVGSAYPHKGLNDLLAAWPGIKEAYPEIKLVIAGEMDVFMRGVKAEAEGKKLTGIEFLGRISDQRLAELYYQAAALIFPSHFEGFGLPPLEALAHGCPVISSDAASLPEVLGKNGATYFRAGDSGGILAAVRSVLDDLPQARLKAAAAVQELAARHDWKNAAAQTLQAYCQVLG